ncbi:MAG: DUF87 domain-containing protein [Planctomycetes bacterium]|nr:DUF87 domain-containing protein [Planctomycetota bacterium]
MKQYASLAKRSPKPKARHESPVIRAARRVIVANVLVAITAPAANDRGPQYMDQALAAIHEANPDRLPVALEYASYEGTVKLFCRFPRELRAMVEGQLFAQYPDCKMERNSDIALNAPAEHKSWSIELQLRPDLFPIRRYPQFEDALNRVTADPLTAILTTLAAERRERCRSRITIVLRPARQKVHARGKKVLRRLARPFFRSHPRVARVYAIASMCRSLPVRVLAWLLGSRARDQNLQREHTLDVSAGRLHEREDDLQAGADKLGKLLFDARIRLTVSGPKDARAHARKKLREMAGAFGQFSLPRLASFRVCRFGGRPFLLSTEEAATLWHLPTLAVRAPTMAIVESRELEAPVTLPTPMEHPGLAVFGVAAFRFRRERFGILPDDRRRHVVVLGKTGMGKSTLLLNLLASDIAAGRGVGLVDPHGDLAETVLQSVPKWRTNDVVLFDAGDATYPLSFNVLACPRPEQRPLVASGIVGAFKKAYSDSWGPRLEHILRNAVLALLEAPHASLVSVLRLLVEPHYRKTIVPKVSDPAVRAF